MNGNMSPDDLVAGYRFVLGRNPEAELNTEAAARSFSDWQQFRHCLFSSEEGKNTVYEQLFGTSQKWLRVPTKFGRLIYLCLSDIAVSKVILLKGEWEPEVEKGIRSLITPDSVFVDVGANLGWFSLLVADYQERNSGSGHVISIEANPAILPYLMSSIVESGLAPRVSLKPYAIAEKTGLVQMETFSEGNVGGINIKKLQDNGKARNIVPTISLDDLLGDLDRIDLIKMDIEGAEPLALEGAKDLLRRHRPKIIMELNGVGLRGVSGKTEEDVVKYMEDYGYKVYDFRSNNPIPMTVDSISDIIKMHSYYDFLFFPE